MSQQLTFLISQDGLALELRVGLPASELQAKLALGQPFLAATPVRALIDTGADRTAVSPGALARLGLVSSGRIEMVTASGSVMVNRYEISLSIFGPAGIAGPALVRPTWLVTDFVQPLPGVEALIGMDLIGEIILTVNGPGRTFRLDF
jgi:hypothetical protein